MHHHVRSRRRHRCRGAVGVADVHPEVVDKLVRKPRPLEQAPLDRVERQTGHLVSAANQEERKPGAFETGVPGDQVVHRYRVASATYSRIGSAKKSSIASPIPMGARRTLYRLLGPYQLKPSAPGFDLVSEGAEAGHINYSMTRRLSAKPNHQPRYRRGFKNHWPIFNMGYLMLRGIRLKMIQELAAARCVDEELRWRRHEPECCVWGAASKGVIYSLLRERCGNPVNALIDINPAKCGKFVPATGLRVMSPEDGMATLAPGSDICVMNSNYLQEIRKMTGDRFNLIGVERD